MLTYKLRGFGVSTKLVGAEIIRDGDTPTLEAIILEPLGRAERGTPGWVLSQWPQETEDRWRQAVMRRARWLAKIDPRITYLVQYDPGRDNAEMVEI